LKVLLKPEKLKEDGAMPSSKNNLMKLYQKCVGKNAHISLLDPHGINVTNNAWEKM
jgi:hypothetical protein